MMPVVRASRVVLYCAALILSGFLSLNITNSFAQTVGPDGSFNYSIDIEVPQGTAGLQPHLALVYNSNSENGMLGIGWQLAGLPVITRDTTHPINYDGTDHYVGPNGRLVLADSAESIYRTEEESFSKFKGVGSQGDAYEYWIETKPDGTKYYYGLEDDSRVVAIDHDTSVRAWALSKVEDLHGNYYSVEYDPDEGEYYPVKIIYTQGNGLSNYRTVEFNYNKIDRTDYCESYSQSSKVITRWLLDNITIKVDVVRFLGIAFWSNTVRSYSLEYDYAYRSSVHRIIEIGDNGDAQNTFTLGWLQEVSSDLTIKGWTVTNAWGIAEYTWSGDFNGDGKADLASASGGNVYTKLSTGSEFACSTWTVTNPWGAAGYYWTGDFNGDGKTDIASAKSGSVYMNLSTGSGFSCTTWTVTNPWGEGRYTWTGDFNGDGKTDIASAKSGSVYMNLSTGSGFSCTTWTVTNPWGVAGYYWTGDFNGDGKTDIASASGGNVYVNLSTGNGFSSVTWTVANLWGDASYTWTGDFNGDGKTDIASASGGNVYVNLSTGSGFICETWLVSSETLLVSVVWGRADNTWIGDFNGDGKTDIATASGGIVYRMMSTGSSFTIEEQGGTGTWGGGNYIRTGDFNGDGKTDIASPISDYVYMKLSDNHSGILISSILNSIGKSFSVYYSPASKIAEATMITPSYYPYISNNSFRNLATKITTEDGRGASYSTSYEYKNGKTYMGFPYQRKDLLFEYVKQINDNTSEYIKTFYIQNDHELAGRVSRVENYAGNGNLSKTIDYQYEKPHITTGSATTLWVRVKQEDVTTCDPSTGNTFSSSSKSLTYDAFGNITISTETVPGQNYETTIAYSVDEANWILNRPIEIKKTSGGNILQWTRMGYTGNDLTTKEEYLNPGSRWITTSLAYDVFGNVISVTDTLNHTTSFEYDEDYHTFVTKITNPLGHVVEQEFDARFGVKTAVTDANGNVTRMEYDEFGRLKKIIEPGDSWTRQIFYGNASDQHVEEWVKDDSSPRGYREVTTYFDGLGREYKKVTVFAGASASELYEQTVKKEYDTAGRVSRETYIDGCDEERYTDFQYDPIGRLTRKTYPLQNGIRPYETFVYEYTVDRYRITNYDVKNTKHVSEFDALGNLRLRNDADIATVNYEYDAAKRLIRTVDAGGNITTITYDTLGRKTSMIDPNTGPWAYSYDDAGRLLTQTDAKGQVINRTYDPLGRVTREYSSDATIDTNFAYDDTSKTNARGRLTSVIDATGDTTYAYTAKGLPSATVKTVDAMSFAFGMEYDVQKRLSRLTYPDGKAVERRYSSAGFLEAVLYEGNTVVQYGKGEIENTSWCDSHVIKRRTGNGVETSIDYNPETLRPTSVHSTKLDSSNQNVTLEHVVYHYDELTGNITGLQDMEIPTNSESYEYDNLGRLTRGHGVYGDKRYSYDPQGNLTQKDGFTHQYSDPQHPHAVTNDGRGNTYAYDANGNMTLRRGKTLSYDSKNQLASIWDGVTKKEEYTYDHSGFRVKKWKEDGSAVYNINGLYEVAKVPNTPDRATKYIHGMEGDLVAQLPVTQTQGAQIGLYGIKKDMYNWKNPQGLALKIYSAVRSFFEDSRNYRVMVQVLLGLTLLGCGALLAYTVRFRKKPFPIAFPRLAHGVPVVLALFIAVFGITGCDIPLLGDSDIAGINYFHPNHLGSVKLITDNTGAVIADYKYAPYGELLREYSSNTSASKYKYTGQEEDEDTGLYYYKARFYDSSVGRFVSADSVISNISNTQSYNRYMFVYANPISFCDPYGHSPKDFIDGIKKAAKQVKEFAKEQSGYNAGGWGNVFLNAISMCTSKYLSLSHTYDDGWGISLSVPADGGTVGISWQEEGFNRGISVNMSYGVDISYFNIGFKASSNLTTGVTSRSVGLTYTRQNEKLGMKSSIGFGYGWIYDKHGNLIDRGPYMSVSTTPRYATASATVHYWSESGKFDYQTSIKPVYNPQESRFLNMSTPLQLLNGDILSAMYGFPLIRDLASVYSNGYLPYNVSAPY